MAKYYYAAGTSPGAGDLIDWTDNGTGTSFINTDVELEPGQTYYTTVIAENGAGLLSEPVSSDRVTAILFPCPEDDEACLDDGVFELTGAEPPGGIYSGPGIEDGKYFNPEAAGVGDTSQPMSIRVKPASS